MPQSKGMRLSDLFDEEDMQNFAHFLDKWDIDSVGYKILEMHRETSNQRQIYLGVVVPVVMFALAYFVARKGARAIDSDGDSNDGDDIVELFDQKAHRLWIIGFVWGSLLIFTNLMAALTIWGVAKRHPEWDEEPYTIGRLDLTDTYNGSPAVFSDTAPQDNMSDDQFGIYTGYVAWITCLIAGLGSEVFVWYHFIQIWSDQHEGLWRFAQFIFPLMALVSLGLAAHQNFLSLPIIVAGLWKFGFPETLMCTYLGLFGTSNTRNQRVGDLLDGMGTVLHHGAASYIISMMTVGVFPGARCVFGPIFILVMQHWVVLIAYSNTALYTAIELVLEYYFEWTVFCKCY